MSLGQEHLIVPDWPAPVRVRSLQTTRHGGGSCPPYNSLNLGMHVGDAPMQVAANRSLLNDFLPTEPVWLEQVHGTQVVLAEQAGCAPRADACLTFRPNAVCAVMTADCLPVLLCDAKATVVAAIHAGWRGLADGVIEATVLAMGVPSGALMAWLGPAIGPQSFEVGADVRDAFVHHDIIASAAFMPCARKGNVRSEGEKYLANLYLLARQRLNAIGVMDVYGGNFCTYREPDRFYSYRRDGQTGRMATMIWLSPA